jgi:hypothetical protein
VKFQAEKEVHIILSATPWENSPLGQDKIPANHYDVVLCDRENEESYIQK